MLAIFLLYRTNDINDFETTRRSEYGLTAGILQVALVLGIGSVALTDIVMLLLVNVAIQVLGWVYDKTNDDFIKPVLPYLLFSSVEVLFVIIQSLNIKE